MTISQEIICQSSVAADTSLCASVHSDSLSHKSLLACREAESLATLVVADGEQSRQRRCAMEDLLGGVLAGKLQGIPEDDALSDVTTAGDCCSFVGSFDASEPGCNDDDSDNMIFAFEEDTTNEGKSTEQVSIENSDAAGVLEKERKLTLTDIIFIGA
mmetsp:Transcript_136236/g.236887  ORF Transcript_136236/g.236887 Transcript_136236/m.236887 type:complete len:158 (+) Transcript_136236:144-617(+)